MPFTVSCSACNSRFLLGDDLFRRKVSGNVVTVKCRNCETDISVDARDVDTLPSHESPRRAPAPPRPKDKLGIVPAKPTGSATSTPISADSRSVWDSEQTVSIAGKAQPESGLEPELLDFEEIEPNSGSDAPPLNTLTRDPGLVHPPRPKKRTDDLLASLSAGTGGFVGAPTIDISSFASPPPPGVEALESDMDAEVSTPRARMATMPLFDMSEVLPAASNSGPPGADSEEPLRLDFGPGTAAVAASTAKVRERKYVVAPKPAAGEEAPSAEPEAKRAGVFVLLGIATLAAALLLFVGVRRQRSTAPVTIEPAVASALAASIAAPSAALAPPSADTASAAAEIASAAASEAPPVNAAPSSIAKNIPTPKIVTRESAKPDVAVTAEKPAEAEAVAPVVAAIPAVEARTAIEPAAPGTEFDKSAALSALKSAAAQASSCRKDGDPSGTATLTITFAESGRVTSATVQGPPFAGTATGGCIASTMRHASIPAFDGDRVTVTKTVVIE